MTVSKGRKEKEKKNTSEMTGYMIPLCTRCATILPLASKTEIVCALPADVSVAEMVVELVWLSERLVAVLPETRVHVVVVWKGRGVGGGERVVHGKVVVVGRKGRHCRVVLNL